MRILILKPSSLGDVVQALPVLRLLKRHLPAAEIHWWIDTRFQSLLEGDPDLAGLIPFDRNRWSRPWHWPEVVASVRRLRALRFDWVIDLQSLVRSSAVAWLANGSLTIGLDDPREAAHAFYDVAVPRPSYETHAVDWYLEVLRHLRVPVHRDFDWLPSRPEVVACIRAKWDPDGTRWIALQPGARWENKRWPARSFGETAVRIAREEPEVRFVVLGGNDEFSLGDAIAAAIPGRCLNLAGRTGLWEMVEWLRACRLLITNDTGPMHIAAALGTPVVALFGPTHPARTGPYGQPDGVIRRLDLPCVPCMKSTCRYNDPIACLRGIPAATVAARALRRLRERDRPVIRMPGIDPPCLSQMW